MNEKNKRRLTIGIYAGVSAILFGLSVTFSCLYLDQSKKLDDVQVNLGQVTSVKKELEVHNEALNDENKALNTTIDDLNGTIRQMEGEIAAGKESLAEKHAETEQLNENIQTLREANSAADDQIEALQKQVEELNAGMDELSAAVETLEQQNDSKNKSLERMAERTHTLKNTVDALTDDLEAANGELEAANDELKTVSDELEAANDAIEELKYTPPTVMYVPSASEPAAETPTPAPVREIPATPAAEGSVTEQLMTLMRSGAPLKWARDGSGGFVKVYPRLAYEYLDLSNGEEVTYNADEVMYSASLIKAPYIYTVLREIEAFEAGEHERDQDGKIIYKPGEEKYDLSEVWTYDPDTMWEEGSGIIVEEEAGFSLTWKELIEYALLYSDNVAFAQTRQRFGYGSFYAAVAQLGITGTASGFMNLSARDCAKFLKDMYGFFQTGGELAQMMKADMARSKHPEMIVSHYPTGMASHKYGWDVGAFHDMAIVFDERPYAIVIMTDYEDGGDEPVGFFGNVVELTKRIHAGE